VPAGVAERSNRASHEPKAAGHVGQELGSGEDIGTEVEAEEGFWALHGIRAREDPIASRSDPARRE
jgi:hypothetical protein